jgi:hypothetical protein
MAADTHDSAELRRYLLGVLADEPRTALEQEYFAHEELLDRVHEAESDLIDDYLAGRLAPDERERFELYYLATPGHRHRVAVARALRSASGAPTVHLPEAQAATAVVIAAPPPWRRASMWALAAALALLVAGTIWMLRWRTTSQYAESVPALPLATNTSPPAPQPPDVVRRPDAPAVVAVSLAAGGVRGSSGGAILTIPPGANLIRLDLEGDPAAPRPVRARAIVRAVSGATVWQGPTVAETPATVAARLEIPAATLPPDDYIVILLAGASDGREAERERYFLRVRSP